MSKKKICISVVIPIVFLFISLCLTLSVSAQPNPKNVYTGNLGKRPLAYAPGRVVVKFADWVGEDEAEQVVRGVGAKIKRRAYKNTFHVLTVPRGQEMKMVQALRRNSRVLYADPDYLAYADFVPNDEYYRPYQWNLDNTDPNFRGIQMEDAWDINPGGDPSVIVAVLDTGIAYENFGIYCQAPDLESTSFVEGYDFVNNDWHPNDDNGHGTHVAGTIAENTNNEKGAAGIAFNVSLMPVKVLNADGTGYLSDIAEAIRWAADHGADVINMSLSASLGNRTLRNAVKYAYDSGVVIVASSGNDSRNTPGYPANYPQVIAVGATTYDHQLAYYSNRGNELCAPGGTDKEDLNGDGRMDMILQQTFDLNTREVCTFGYWFGAGTSMAAPHVSGLAALIISQDSSLTNDEVRTVLRENAHTDGIDSACGYGLINAFKALDAVADVDNPPTVEIKYPGSGATVSGPVTITAEAGDDHGVSKVEFFIDDQSIGEGTFGSDVWYVDWNTESATNGPHTISAIAWDTGGQPSNTYSITVNVCNLPDCVDNPPTVEIKYPGSGATVSGPVTITAEAGDDHGVSKVEFFIDNQSIGEGTFGSDVWYVDWNTESATNGPHTISATAWDNANQTATNTIAVTVDNPELSYIHVGDLDGSSFNILFGFWGTTIKVTVHNSNEEPVANAAVSGVFSDGPSVFQCTTGGNGMCSVTGYQWNLSCLTFYVTSVQFPDYEYMASFNHDQDGDSDGTAITTCRP
jgi:serine protease